MEYFNKLQMEADSLGVSLQEYLMYCQDQVRLIEEEEDENV